jgi:hypothetical protein
MSLLSALTKLIRNVPTPPLGAGGLRLIFLAFLLPSVAFAQNLTEDEARKKLEARGDSLDPIEGIWVISTIQQFYRYDTLYDVIKYPKGAKVAVIKDGEHFVSYNLSGDAAEIRFTLSDVPGVYVYKNHFRETDSDSKVSGVICRNGRMEIVYEFPEKYLRYKLQESFEEGTRVVNNTSWVRTYPDASKAKK